MSLTPSRRDLVLDSAIEVLGEGGVRALTHRGVDAAAGLPAGSTSNLFRTRQALSDAVAERITARELANWEDLALRLSPSTPAELARALAAFVQESAGAHRTLTLARYAILVEAAQRPELRARLAVTGARVNARFAAVLAMLGSRDPERDLHLILNYGTGVLLHQLAVPDPAFDPAPQLTVLLESLIATPDPASTPEESWNSTVPGRRSTPSAVP
ncbi:MAG: hypothetical protein WAL50_07485 [Kineosporiaceae bacterium]